MSFLYRVASELGVVQLYASKNLQACKMQDSERSFSGITLLIRTMMFDQLGLRKEVVVLDSPFGTLNGYTTDMRTGITADDADERCWADLNSKVTAVYLTAQDEAGQKEW